MNILSANQITRPERVVNSVMQHFLALLTRVACPTYIYYQLLSVNLQRSSYANQHYVTASSYKNSFKKTPREKVRAKRCRDYDAKKSRTNNCFSINLLVVESYI